MSPANHDTAIAIAIAIEQLYRQSARKVFATLVRLLGDLDLAEEALHDAFKAAIEQWPSQGMPANPLSWLVSAGRFKAIDSIRRNRLFTAGRRPSALGFYLLPS